MRHIHLLIMFFRIGALNEMAYRANFWLQVFESLLLLGGALATVGIVYTRTETLGGWHPSELVALLGVYFLVLGSINVVISPSLSKFMEHIVTGDLDYTLTKPEDAQFLVSFSEFRIWKLIDVGLGLAVLLWAVIQRAEAIGFASTLMFCVALLAGGAIVYSFWMIMATFAFWFIRIENILQVFWAVYTAGRWPVGIYPQWLRWLLTVVVPVAFAVTVPAEAIAGRANIATIGGAVLLAAILLLVSRWFWKQGLKKYSGASA